MVRQRCKWSSVLSIAPSPQDVQSPSTLHITPSSTTFRSRTPVQSLHKRDIPGKSMSSHLPAKPTETDPHRAREYPTMTSLTSLSGDLRNRIYALDHDLTLGVSWCCENKCRWICKPESQPAITRVSRQIRAETLPIFYAGNDCILHIGHTLDSEVHSVGRRIVRWLRKVSKHLLLFKSVKVSPCMDGSCCTSIYAVNRLD